MSGSPQEATLPPEASAMKQGVDWVAKHWARVRLGHEGMMLEKIQRQNRFVEVDARNTMTGKVDDVGGLLSMKDTEMGVDIGDTIHNYYPPAPPPVSSPAPAQQPKPKRSSWLKKAALTAVLIGSGGGTGIAIPFLLGMFDKPPPVAAPAADEWTERRLENYVPPGGSVE